MEKGSKKKTIIDMLFAFGIGFLFIGIFYFYTAFYTKDPINLITAFIFMGISIIELLISCLILWIVTGGESYGS